MIVSAGSVAILGGVVFGTSVLSGVFGMAGGMVLLGVLLLVMDVAPAMILFGIIQFAANGWRAWLWRSYVRWRIVGGYVAGSLVSFAAMKAVALLPDKAVIYILLGLVPFVTAKAPPALAPHITRRGVPFLSGLVLMPLQLIAGATGSVLDMFFNRSELDRKTIVATKAATQTAAHALRIAYFGSVAFALGDLPPGWVIALAVVCAIGGTTFAAGILHRMTDSGFKRWSNVLINAISIVYVARGLWLLATG
ncbi:TSUP family transporter [Alsobacter sp. R-9]